MSVANPYWIIWWATIGLGYIIYSWRFGFWGIAFFFVGHILADLVWYSLIAAAVAGGRHFLTDRLYRSLIASCAVFLIVFAGYFAYAGFEKLNAVFLWPSSLMRQQAEACIIIEKRTEKEGNVTDSKDPFEVPGMEE
jgi:hypothetical protein